MSLLEIKDLTVTFHQDGREIRAVRGVSLRVEPGETLALVGESGSGKSLTALSTVKLLPDTAEYSGAVLFKGADTLTMSARDLQRVRGNDISFIFQEPMTSLNPLHTIEKQLAEALLLHQGLTGARARARVIDLLDKVGINDPEGRLSAYPHQLSGGQRQRVMIAMALANGPELLIADEPTTALDVTVQAQILELIADLQKDIGMSVILITHDLGVIAEVCDEVAVMYAGRIVEKAGVHDLFARPRHAYTQGLLESIPRLDSTPKSLLKAIPGNVPGIADFKSGCRFADRSGRAHGEHHLTQRPAFAEIAPGHWVENCPICVPS
jgi:peptide/nickel transport system ATP-binding protein